MRELGGMALSNSQRTTAVCMGDTLSCIEASVLAHSCRASGFPSATGLAEAYRAFHMQGSNGGTHVRLNADIDCAIRFSSGPNIQSGDACL
jgi:hypothetical protein